MVWCYFMFWFLFVDQNAQLRLAGEYYVKSFMKTIFAIMCIKGVFALHVFGLFCSQDDGGGGGTVEEEESVAVVVAAITLQQKSTG